MVAVGQGFDFQAVVVVRGGRRALDRFTGHIPADGVTALFGPSGSGKSTLLRLCNRLEVPASGRVRYNGDDIASLDPLKLRRQVGMVFQRPTPFPGTVRDNLRAASPDATTSDFERALTKTALDGDFLERDANELSGGEAQRVCVARTLITKPDVLLLDEPTSALDEEASQVLERAVCGLTDIGVTVVWVTHDQAQVERVADRVIRISDGRQELAGGSE